jgi:hypothetical protein
MASTSLQAAVPSISVTSGAPDTYGPGQLRASGTLSHQLVMLHGFAADAFGPDMTDLVLSNPDLVREVVEGDRELREGRGEFLSLEEAFGE